MKRARTQRRKAQRQSAKLGDAREKLAAISEGGSPDRPLEVESASIVEGRALALGCARCEGEVRLDDHAAVHGLRRVRTRCKACRSAREVWVRVAERLLS
jgi:hypothetical protein